MNIRLIFLVFITIFIFLAGCINNIVPDTIPEIHPAGPTFAAHFTGDTIPESIENKAYFWIFLTVTNVGADTWNIDNPNPVHLSYHWTSENQTVVFDGIRTSLPDNVQMGKSAEIKMIIQAPDKPGNYSLIIDLVKEDVTWFEYRNTTPLIAEINVVSGHERMNNTFNYSTGDSMIDGLQDLLLSTMDSSLVTFPGRSGKVYGFTAGGSYPQIWIRDSATILPFARYLYGDEYLRTWIEEFLVYQAENGSVYDFVSLAGIDKNTVETDQESSLVHSAYFYYNITNNDSWLQKDIQGERIIDRLDKALMWVLNNRYDQAHGLVIGAYTADWGDVQFEDVPGTDITENTHFTIDIYDNALFYRACRELSEMHSNLGNHERAGFWAAQAHAIRTNVNDHLWNDNAGYYKMHIVLPNNEIVFDDSHILAMGGNTMAILTGCANESQTTSIITNIIQKDQELGATSIGCVLYPPYPHEFFANPIMDEEYEYQNGGLWDWYAGRFILAEFEHGFSNEAIQHLHEIAAQDLTAGGLYEWYTPDGVGMGSANYTGSAGVLGQCIIEGYFGIHLSHDSLKITPRLGDQNGSISLAEPRTGTSISYTYTALPDSALILNCETNYPNDITVNILIPEKSSVNGLIVDSIPTPYSIFSMGNDRYLTFRMGEGIHNSTVLL